MRRDELGSELHLMDLAPWGPPEAPPWPTSHLVGTGRDGLRLALQAIRDRWPRTRRAWVPSYACPSVLWAFDASWTLRAYADLPGEPPELPQADADDVLLLHDPFGLRARPDRPHKGIVLEDHSHAPFGPWATTSEADFAFASLRKLLPIADGGVVWSPRGHALPDLPTTPDPVRQAAVGAKLEGMRRKSAYLNGEPEDKEQFRALLAEGERLLGESGPAPMSAVSRQVVFSAPHGALRQARRESVDRLEQALASLLGRVVHLLPAAHTPAFAVLRFTAPELRNRSRLALIDAGIFPSALWPVETLPPAVRAGPRERAFARCSFVLPIDARATASSLERAAEVIRASLAAADAIR